MPRSPFVINDPTEFARYCQESPDEDLLGRVAFAVALGSRAVLSYAQYGGANGITSHLDEALNNVQGGQQLDRDLFVGASDVLRRFWEHGEEFGRWFDDKVIIVVDCNEHHHEAAASVS
jgi:hypothetical protein